MAIEIKDATGTGNSARVDTRNRLAVFSVSEPEDKHLNIEGKVWSLPFSVTPAGANDYFFYLTNTGDDILAITDIRISSSVVTEVTYEVVTGVPSYVTGTDVTPVNRNLGSSRLPTATIRYDTDITGLTTAGTIFFEECSSVDTRYKLSTSSNILIPKGKSIAFKRVAATGLINCVVSLVNAAPE